MTGRRHARLYAQALLDTATLAGQAEAVGADLQALGALLAKTPELPAFLGRYDLPEKTRQAALRAVFAGVTPLVARLLDFLERRNELPALAAVCVQFAGLADRARGIQPVCVETAEALTPAQAGELARKLGAKLGREVRLDVRTNPELLGGFTAQADDLLFDYSLAGRLDRLRRQLTLA